MTNTITNRVARDLYQANARTTRNVRFYFQQGQASGETLSDYRSRAMIQIERGLTQPNEALDSHLLD